MNTKAQESDKKEIPLLIRSAQWTVAEKIENQVAAVCLKNKQDDMILQQNQKIVELNQKIDQQSKLIEQLNQKIDQQNREKDDLNNHLYLQKESAARSQSSLGIQEKNEQNKDNKTYLNIPLKSLKDSLISPSSGYPTAILMADANSNPNATVFGSRIKRSEISAIYVKNTLKDMPSSAWDVSDSKDGSVMAWTQSASDSVNRILFLAANGNIYANPDCSYLFANYTNLIDADFTYLKMDLVTNMRYMFSFCTALRQLDVSHWDVSCVTDMTSMFEHCEQLRVLDVSHWNVVNVTKMNFMFFYCIQLKVLDVSQWNVSSVTNMNFMFNSCKQLQTLDVSHWDVSNVTKMERIFSNCRYINHVEKGFLSSWKLNPAVTIKSICNGTKFEDNPMDLFQK